jgi:general secretion pathway protein K
MRPLREAGLALIAALVVITAASLLLTLAWQRQAVALRRIELGLAEAAAWRALEGLERQVLAKLLTDPEPGQDAAPQVQRLATGGRVECRVEALAGHFNLASLLNREGQPASAAVAVLGRLYTAQGLDPGLVDAVLDWQDADHEPRPGRGAEASWYASARRPYPVSNRPFVDPSELKLVRGMTARAYAELAPLITSLPEATAIDLDLAPESLLPALDPHFTPALAAEFAAARPFTDAAARDAWLSRHGITPPGAPAEVGSRYYAVACQVEARDARLATTLWVRRPTEGPLVSLGRRGAEP